MPADHADHAEGNSNRFLRGLRDLRAKFAPRGVAHTYRYAGKTPGRLMSVITPSGFEGFFEEIAALTPQKQRDIPRVMEIAKKFGLEILPPPAA